MSKPWLLVANVLIAAGALAIGLASTLTRLGYDEYLYLGELISAILMFVGFRLAAKPQPEAVVAQGPIPASADEAQRTKEPWKNSTAFVSSCLSLRVFPYTDRPAGARSNLHARYVG